MHAYAGRLSLDEQQNKSKYSKDGNEQLKMCLASKPIISVAQFHSTAAAEKSAVALILGLGAISAGSYAASSALTAYNEWKASLPDPPPEKEKAESVKEEENTKQQKEQAQKQEESGGKRENIFAKWFGVGVGSKYWEGGFEETMTRREAALILGIRESSSTARIKEAHRKLLMLNHPDTGGSTYMALKINDAKELLLKGRRDT